MNVEITTRNCNLEDGTKERVEARMEKLRRFNDRVSDARVVVSQQGDRYSAEAIVLANGLRIVSHAEEDTDKLALAVVLDRIEGQVKRHRDRMVKRHRKATAMGEAMIAPTPPPGRPAVQEEGYEAFGDEADFEGLVSEDPGDVTVGMQLAEAVAVLRASRREVLAFTNPDTGNATMVFKRRDGNVGIVEMAGDDSGETR